MSVREVTQARVGDATLRSLAVGTGQRTGARSGAGGYEKRETVGDKGMGEDLEILGTLKGVVRP